MSPARARANETNMTLPTAGSAGNSGIRGVFGVRGLIRALAGAAVVLVALLGGSTAALAHDALESSSPGNGSTVATAPDQVTMTMSNTPAAIGSQVNVLDSTGKNWSDGPVQVVDNVVTQPLKPGAPAGKFTVQWRLVSSDSHVIEGDFAFTATAANAAAPAGGSTAGATAGNVQPLQATNQPQGPLSASLDGVPWSVVGLVAILLVVIVAMVMVARRRLGPGE
jgi:copper resistance protein C